MGGRQRKLELQPGFQGYTGRAHHEKKTQRDNFTIEMNEIKNEM